MATGKDGEDVALLRLATRDAMPAIVKLCPPDKIPEGRGLITFSVGCDDGIPNGRDETIKSRVSVRRPGAAALVMWETESRPVKGRSGGPLVDQAGCLLGVCSGASGREGYFVHTEAIHSVLKQNGYRWIYQTER
jgi:hypothetical protein